MPQSVLPNGWRLESDTGGLPSGWHLEPQVSQAPLGSQIAPAPVSPPPAQLPTAFPSPHLSLPPTAPSIPEPVQQHPVVRRQVMRLDMGNINSDPAVPSVTSQVSPVKLQLPSTPSVAPSVASSVAPAAPPVMSSAAPAAAKLLASPAHAVEVTQARVSGDLPQLPLKNDISERLLNWSPHKITVSLPDKKVIVQDDKGNVVRTYAAYTGKASAPTPQGQFRIIEDNRPDPKGSEWYYGGHFLPFKQVPDQADPRFTDSFGFHGWSYTKEDDEIEKQEPGWKTNTHGCVQLNNHDIADFSSLVKPGDPVTIVNEPWQVH